MSDLSSIERLKFEALLGMESGYVLDFSNNTFSTFTIENVGVDIFDSKYEYGSSSKANRLRKFWLEESNEIVGKLLSALLDSWLAKKQIRGEELSSKEKILYDECQKTVYRLNQSSSRQTPKDTSSPSQKGRIFISYRRADTSYAAGRIYDRLVDHFGKDPIFMDVDALEGGVDFVKVLEDAVQSCDVLIALIGRQWLSVTDKGGKRRLDNPEDFVRIEIATALERNIRVIPVLVDGVEMPRSTDLPENLKVLARRNALQVNHHSFNPDVYRLIEHTKSALNEAERSKVMKVQALQAEREKAEKEVAEKAVREKVEKEAAEKTRLKAMEEERQRTAKEKTERETAEKAAQEKARLEVVERARKKAVKEKAEREADKKAAKEQIPENDLPEFDDMPPPPDRFPDDWDTQWQPSFGNVLKDGEEKSETIEKDKTVETTYTKVEKPSTKKKQIARKPYTVAIVILIGFAAIILGLVNSQLFEKQPSIIPTLTETITSVQTTEPTQITRYDIPYDGHPSFGPEDAEIILIEFAGFQDPYSKKWYNETFQKLFDAFPGKIRLVYRNFPIVSIHPDSFTAAEASLCANDQGAYWQYHDLLYSSDKLGSQVYLQYATDLSLDLSIFQNCLSSEKHKDFIQNDLDFAYNHGIRSSPTFFINDESVIIVGAQPFEVFKQVIDDELAEEIPK